MGSTKNFRHIAIDMQRLFAEPTPWYSPTMMQILPNVLKLSEDFREQTLYARFVVPHNADSAQGNWKKFYRRWPMITGEVLDPTLLDLMFPFADLADSDQVFDKFGYSAFSNPTLDTRLRDAEVDTLILSGVETDVCVYSTALSAIDLGYSVILAEDALSSPDAAAHSAVLNQLVTRLPEQITIMKTDEILAASLSSQGKFMFQK